MSRNSRALLLGALALLLGASPTAAANRCAGGGAARPDDSGVGGTGIQAAAPRPDDSGIGGTGARPESPEDDDSGVGGTGVSAENDLGVIGTITGFASICVGDVEIAYDAASVVTVDGQRASSADLAVGQVVEVVASGSGTGLGAREIAVRHVVAGPVTRAANGDEIEVIGQKVRLTPTTRGDVAEGLAPAIGELAPGTYVRVSGMRQTDGTIVASRVARGDGAALLSGSVESAGDDHFTVAGTTVRLATSPDWSPGDEVRVAGSWSGDHLVATSLERVPRVPFDGRVGRVEIEGYARLTAAGELRVGPYGFELSRDTVAALPEVAERAPIRIDANVRDGRAIIEHIGAAPELPPRPSGMQGRPPGNTRGGDAAAREGRPEGAPPRADGRMEAPYRPDRPDRPAARPPDRPPHLDRPPPLVRPDLPSRPDRPPRPGRP